MTTQASSQGTVNNKDLQNREKTKGTEDTTNEKDPVNIEDQGSSSLMGLENNITGNSADRQGDTTNSSGGSYRKSNREI